MKVLGLLLLVSLAAAGPIVNNEFLDGYNKFTSELYKEVKQKHSKNFMISPISIDILLALAEYGSAGETSRQLMKGLSLPENKKKIREAFTALTPQLNKNDKYTLNTANKVYVHSGVPLLEDFKKIAEEVYSAPVESVNFANNVEAANKINKWVEEKTHNKIKDLVDKDQISEDTRTFFLNAIYFRGKWVKKFHPRLTEKQHFYLNDKTTTDIDLMSITNDFKFYNNHDLNAKFLELPYDGNDVVMTIVLPNNRDGLDNLEDKMSEVLAPQGYKKEHVNVKIPKFKVETSIEFNDYLKKLGIVNAFQENAEFPKINGKPLYINKALQKAFIEVDEEGTTAAVASAVDGVSRSAHVLIPTEDFIADHPFIFFLKYKSVVLFIGHFTGKDQN